MGQTINEQQSRKFKWLPTIIQVESPNLRTSMRPRLQEIVISNQHEWIRIDRRDVTVGVSLEQQDRKTGNATVVRDLNIFLGIVDDQEKPACCFRGLIRLIGRQTRHPTGNRLTATFPTMLGGQTRPIVTDLSEDERPNCRRE